MPPPTASRPRSELRRYFIFWLALTALAVDFTLAWVLSPHKEGYDERSMPVVLGYNLLRFWSWAALTPLIVALDRRLKRRRSSWAGLLGWHLAATFVLGAFHTSTIGYCCYLIEPMKTKTFSEYLSMMGTNHMLVAGILYALILATHYAIEYYEKYQDERVRSAVLEARAAQSELQALRMQLQPHFLFNALNSISSLTLEEPRAAVRMIACLGDFLRLTIDSSRTDEVTLQEELEFLRGYLEIEQVRFRDRLEVTFHTEPTALRALVPNLILQPIVENAIKHGIASTLAGGQIQVRARRRDQSLEVRVENDGPRVAALNGQVREGVGLLNTRERLQQLYRGDFALSLELREEGGAVVTLRIPYREAAAAQAGPPVAEPDWEAKKA